jgi:hypothetical protein
MGKPILTSILVFDLCDNRFALVGRSILPPVSYSSVKSKSLLPLQCHTMIIGLFLFLTFYFVSLQEYSTHCAGLAALSHARLLSSSFLTMLKGSKNPIFALSGLYYSMKISKILKLKIFTPGLLGNFLFISFHHFKSQSALTMHKTHSKQALKRSEN